MNPHERQDQMQRIHGVFTPESPIKAREFFIGRIDVIADCLSIIERPGAHIVLYGNRGVGKTSLASILEPLCSDENKRIVFFTSCDSADTHESIWRKTLGDILIGPEVEGLAGTETMVTPALSDEIFPRLGASEIVNLLRSIGGNAVIIFDEFDRLPTQFNRRIFSDTIKSISDALPNVTLVIVGVGTDISALVGEHASIERNLIQVPLREMSPEELKEIVIKGMEVLKMSVEPRLVEDIVKFSCGYPHFTHLLSLHASRSAVIHGRMSIQFHPDFQYAVRTAIQQSFESLRKAYQDATSGTRESIYEQVLWAVALAPVDEHNTFQPRDLLVPLSRILRKQVRYQAFISHLSQFCTINRGNILEKTGKKRRVRYKLKDPRMRAFLLLKYQETQPPPVGSQGSLFDESE